MHARRCCAFKAFWAAMTIPFVQNGTPFASTAIAGLSALSIWWIKLGVLPERIRPGRPKENDRLERTHRALRDKAIDSVAANLGTQQRASDRFRIESKGQRPP